MSVPEQPTERVEQRAASWVPGGERPEAGPVLSPAQVYGHWTEQQLLQWAERTACLLGWLSYHTYDSRRGSPGFPDLVLVRDGVMLLVELKRMGGRLTESQQRWLLALQAVAAMAHGHVLVCVWRPADIPRILYVLEHGRLPAVDALLPPGSSSLLPSEDAL